MTRLRFGIVGPGLMGEQYIRIYAAHPRAMVVALCGRTRARVDEIADKYAIPGRFTDVGDLLEDGREALERAAEGGCASSVATNVPTTPVGIRENRIPYAPKHMLTAGLGYNNNEIGFSIRAETQCISDMFGDDRNTHDPTPNGQRGIIRGWCVMNASANQYVKPINTTFFVTGKNLLDQLFMVDRTRGIYPGLPLLVQAREEFAKLGS